MEINMNIEYPLSISSLNTYIQCSVKWKYQYVDKYPMLTGSSALIGKAFHKAIEENYKQKIISKKDLSISEMINIYNNAFCSEIDKTLWQEDEDIIEISESGVRALKLYHSQISPIVYPSESEKEFLVDFGSLKLQGHIDLIDQDGWLIETKTASRKPKELYSNYKRQITAYALAINIYKYRFDFSIISRINRPEIMQFKGVVKDIDKWDFKNEFLHVTDNIQKEIYEPNRKSQLCSDKWCCYYERCHSDYKI